jgi:hypothetical protein
MVWAPRVPDPIMTHCPFEGTPLTTTKMRAGPGARMAGLGGTCETWRVAAPLEEMANVEFL